MSIASRDKHADELRGVPKSETETDKSRQIKLEHLVGLLPELAATAVQMNCKTLAGLLIQACDEASHALGKPLKYGQHSLDRAARKYEAIRLELERTAFDQYVRIDAETGEHSIGETRAQAGQAFKNEHGERLAYTFHIGTSRQGADIWE
jgi:hypothetical protein